MAVQTSTTGELEAASREMIAAARYTSEHNAPLINLVERFTLARGSDTLVVPKVGQMSMHKLVEGQEMTQEEDIGMTSVNVTPSEAGGKVVLTDKALRQNTNNLFTMVGKQLGDAMARIKDEDIAALFSALNGGTDLGAAGRTMSVTNTARLVAHAMANKFGGQLRIVHHPNAVFAFNMGLTSVGVQTTPAGANPIPTGLSERRLREFWTGLRMGGASVFQDGNISVDASDDSVGAIFAPGALGILTSVSMNRERERKPSLRGWIVYLTSDYVAFEIDDTKGAPATFDAATPATT